MLISGIEDPYINPHTHEHLTFDEEFRNTHQRKDSIFNSWCGSYWTTVHRRIQIDLYLSPFINSNSKWKKDLNIKPDTLNLTEEKVGE